MPPIRRSSYARREAELAKTTYERWRDSPKGVVSEQEREEKRAGFDSAPWLNSARGGGPVDQAGVDQYRR